MVGERAGTAEHSITTTRDHPALRHSASVCVGNQDHRRFVFTTAAANRLPSLPPSPPLPLVKPQLHSPIPIQTPTSPPPPPRYTPLDKVPPTPTLSLERLGPARHHQGRHAPGRQRLGQVGCRDRGGDGRVRRGWLRRCTPSHVLGRVSGALAATLPETADPTQLPLSHHGLPRPCGRLSRAGGRRNGGNGA